MQNLHSKPRNSQHRGKYLLYSCSTILLIWNPPNKTVCYWYVMKWVNPRPSNWRPDEQWYLPLRWVISDKAIALCWTDLVVHKKVKFDLKSNRWRLCSDDLLRSLELDFRVRIFILITAHCDRFQNALRSNPSATRLTPASELMKLAMKTSVAWMSHLQRATTM